MSRKWWLGSHTVGCPRLRPKGEHVMWICDSLSRSTPHPATCADKRRLKRAFPFDGVCRKYWGDKHGAVTRFPQRLFRHDSAHAACSCWCSPPVVPDLLSKRCSTRRPTFGRRDGDTALASASSFASAHENRRGISEADARRCAFVSPALYFAAGVRARI